MLGADFFKNKTVIDLGCNAGGSAVEILKRGAAFVKCIEGSELAFRQLNLVINSNQDYKSRAQLINYSLSNKGLAELKSELGESQIGMCLGLIYHMNRNDVVALMRYLRDSTDTCIFSSPVKNDGRSVDWVVGYEEIDRMLEEAGFSGKTVLLDAGDQEADWSWMTNSYYFQATK